jgi:hypothetical protein
MRLIRMSVSMLRQFHSLPQSAFWRADLEESACRGLATCAKSFPLLR